MNKFLFFALVVASVCTADEVDDLLQGRQKAAPILDSHEGYDLHKDSFYFDDSLVANAFTRKYYSRTKVTMGGQRPSITGQKVSPAVNPFIVAQKSIATFGSTADRWDIKEDEYKNQYLGLFNGDAFVVNKIRSQLLRRLANAIQDYLPILDSADEDSRTVIEAHVLDIVTKFIMDLNIQIRNNMKENDQSSATGTVVVITQKNLIVVNVGGGRALAYNEYSETIDLTAKSNDSDGQKYCESFGNTKKSFACDPFVEIVPKEGIQILLLETPIVAALTKKDVIKHDIIKHIEQHKYHPEQEQDMFIAAASSVIHPIENSGGMFKKVNGPDATVMMVILEKDYNYIH